jgi:hypothetical protein
MRSACRRLSSDGPPVVAYELSLRGRGLSGRESRRANHQAGSRRGGGSPISISAYPASGLSKPEPQSVMLHNTHVGVTSLCEADQPDGS